MATTTLHEGWAILKFTDQRSPHVGRLRYEQVGQVYQWVLSVPAGHGHHGLEAIIDPSALAPAGSLLPSSRARPPRASLFTPFSFFSYLCFSALVLCYFFSYSLKNPSNIRM